MLKKIKCNLNFSVFTDCDYPEATTCIKHQTKELTDIHEKFGSFPSSYTLANTGIHQRW